MNDFVLTARELDAAIEALAIRLAGELDGDELPPLECYRSVLSKLQDVRAQLTNRRHFAHLIKRIGK